MELKLPRGMRDFPPPEKLLRDEVVATLTEVFERYGFSPLETPVIERWEVLSAKYAGGGEILKETYRLRDQGGRELGLRYDLTTPLARFIGMNPTIKRPFKRYQVGPVYRDGPIKHGRYREFYQCDVDTVGVRSPLADAELILIALDAFQELGFRVEVRVNHRRLLRDLAAACGVAPDRTDGAILAMDKLEKVGREGVRSELLEKGLTPEQADRWLSATEAAGRPDQLVAAVRERVPESEGVTQLSELFKLLPEGDPIRFVPSLARGLGYYTGTIFEVYSLDPPFDSAVAAGGRWDEMIGSFLGGDEAWPAVGISFGLEPITELIKAQRSGGGRRTVTQAYVVPVGVRSEALAITQRLRRAGIKSDLDLGERGISDNLRYADAYGVPYALLVGPEELRQNKVKLRDMRSGEEELLTLDDAISKLKSEEG